MDQNAFDAARVGFKDLELEAAVVMQPLTAHRNAAQHGESEAPQGLRLFFAFLGQEIDAEKLLKLVDAGAGIGHEGAFAALADELGFDRIMLIGYVADDLLDQILD